MILTFVEEDHEYRLDGEVIPSVTEILRPLTAKQYGAINPEVLRIAAERGTDAHAACEAIDYGLEPEAAYPDIAGYIAAYEQFLYDHDVEWYGIEEMGACLSWSINFAGTVDRWGMVDGELCVVDVKTTAQPSIAQKCAVCLQTQMYANIIDDKHDIEPQKRYALYLKKDGDYTLFDCNAFEQKEGLKPYTEINFLLSLWKMTQEATETIDKIQEKHRRKR